MNNYNDTNLVFAPLPGHVEQHDSLTLIAKGTFQLAPDEVATLCEPDDQLPVMGDEYANGGKSGALHYEADFAYFKPKADVLLVGTCHAPGQNPQSQCRVSFGVGQFIKSLLVLGDRQWTGGVTGGRTTQPEPFTTMPMQYQYAALYDKYAEQQTKWSLREFIHEKLPLPNVQPISIANQFTTSVSYEPYGFGPINRIWALRAQKLGSYNGDYLSDYWPWFPKDFDWHYFNAAPEDQQLTHYLKGDEKLYFEHVHAQHAQYRAQLPGMRVRCFLNEAQQHLQNYREIGMNLDTLWVDMDNEKLVLVWRGVAKVKSPDYAEIQQAQLVVEQSSDAPKSIDHYKDQLLEKIYKEEGVDTTLLQTKVQTKADSTIVANADEITLLKPRQGTVAIPQPEDALDELEPELQAQVSQALDQARKTIADVGQDPGLVDKLMTASDTDAALAEIFSGLGIDLKKSEKLIQQSREDTAKQLQEQGVDPGDYLAMFDEDEESVDPKIDDPPAMDKVSIQQQISQGKSFAEQDLTAVDLSNINLSGADFSSAILTNTNLQGSDLSKANLSGANLTGAKLNNAVLTSANLAQADLQGAILNSADLREADITEANFSQCDLSTANLAQTTANQARFTRAILKDANVAESQLTSANFDYAQLDKTNLQAAILKGASFNYTSGGQVNLSNADLSGLRASEACVLKQCNLTQVSGDGAIFTGADLSASNLSQSRFTQSLFTDTLLIDVDMSCSDFSKANFRNASLVKVNAKNSNFFQAILERADLTKANFNSSNLYEVEFLGATIEKTRFSNTNLANTKLAKLKKIQ